MPFTRCAWRKFRTTGTVSPFGSTETAITFIFLPSGPASARTLRRFSMISGQTSGQWA